MPNPAEQDKPDEPAASPATDETLLIRHGKASSYAAKQGMAETGKPAADNPADPTVPFALVAVAVFFLLFFTAVGFVFRRRLLYPLLHWAGLTDEYGHPLLKKWRWFR